MSPRGIDLSSSTNFVRLSSILLIFLLSTIFQFGGEAVRIELEHLPESCGYDHCPALNPNKVNVHLVPHTHDDVGWLKTVDQYYYGSRTLIQNAGVQYILDSVIQALIRNKERRFIYVEIAFFSKWWQEQDNETQNVVRELVSTGQLEFINGGWSMNDEATTHYSGIIDQMTLGLKFLNDTFGPNCARPRVAWHIDPFGHSREQASLFAQMDYDGLFFSRIDYQDHINRELNKNLEFVWHGSDELGKGGDIFTGIIYRGYAPPDNLDWDLIGGADEPIIDNPESEEYNVGSIVEKFVAQVRKYQKYYATNQIMFPMGEDFQYQAAHVWYKNMDKLIQHVNNRTKDINVFYSTPSCYLKGLHQSGHVFQTKSDDFFPYASDPDAFWTGYFTSRPTLKRMERFANNWLQAGKQLNVLAKDVQGKFDNKLDKLREAMGIMQHHDAVAGTEKQHVANDYAKLLQIGLDQSKEAFSVSMEQLTGLSQIRQPNQEAVKYLFCNHLNISSCSFTEQLTNFAVVLYNPFAHPLVNHTVRLPINYTTGQYLQVTNSAGKNVPATIFPIPQWIQTIPGRSGNATDELVFDVSIGALGFNTYFVHYEQNPGPDSAVVASDWVINEAVQFRQGSRTIAFDKTGKLNAINFDSKNSLEFDNDFYYYEGWIGNNKIFVNRSSGAYIFRPKSQKPKLVGKLQQSILYADIDRGLYEVHQTFSSFVHQTIRFHPNKDYIEFDWFVGSIPIEDNVGKEIVAQYKVNLNSDRTFYTDSNGRQLLKRVWNYRPTWNYTVFESTSGNYYPVNSRILLQDQSRNLQLTVMNDRTQGGTSPENGTLELMIHRRLLHDDAFGAGEALNETGIDGQGLVVRGRHLVLLDSIPDSTRKHRILGQQLYLEPVISFYPLSTFHKRRSIATYLRQHRNEYSGLKQSLPEQVNILTLEYWRPKQILLRLENFYQSNEQSKNQTSTATVNLANLFTDLTVESAEELTLGANQNIEASKKRFEFKFGNDIYQPNYNLSRQLRTGSLEISLDPMQIRTFLVTLQ